MARTPRPSLQARRVLWTVGASALLMTGWTAFASGQSPGFHAPAARAPAAHQFVTRVHPEAPVFRGPNQPPRPFRWGWFGAEHFYPTQNVHRDFNGGMISWSRWPRY